MSLDNLKSAEIGGVTYYQIKSISNYLGDFKPQNTIYKINNNLSDVEIPKVEEFGRSKNAISENDLIQYCKVVSPTLQNGNRIPFIRLLNFLKINQSKRSVDTDDRSVKATSDRSVDTDDRSVKATSDRSVDADGRSVKVTSDRSVDAGGRSVKVTSDRSVDADGRSVKVTSDRSVDAGGRSVKVTSDRSVDAGGRSVKVTSDRSVSNKIWFDKYFGWLDQLFVSSTFQLIWCIIAIVLQATQFSDLMMDVWGDTSTFALVKSLAIALVFDMLILFVLMQETELNISGIKSRNLKDMALEEYRASKMKKAVALIVFCTLWILINLCKVGYITDIEIKQILVSIPLPFALVTTTIIFHSKTKSA